MFAQVVGSRRSIAVSLPSWLSVPTIWRTTQRWFFEEPAESFDAWLRELQQGEPLDLMVSGAELVAEARAESGYE